MPVAHEVPVARRLPARAGVPLVGLLALSITTTALPIRTALADPTETPQPETRDLQSAIATLLIAAHERAARGEHMDSLAMLRRALDVSPSPALRLACAESELVLARPDRALADVDALSAMPPTDADHASLRQLAAVLTPEVQAARSATLGQHHELALTHWQAALTLLESAPRIAPARYLIEAARSARRAAGPEHHATAKKLFSRALETPHSTSLSDRERAETRDELTRLASLANPPSAHTPSDTPHDLSHDLAPDLTPWYLAGGALLTLGGGVAMLWVAGDQRDEVRTAMRDGETGVGLTRKEALALEDSANTLSVLGYSSLALGLGLGVASLVWALDEPASRTTIEGLSLDLGPDHFRVWAGGVF